MTYYPLLRPLIFSLPAETAHDLAITALSLNLVPGEPEVSYPSLRQSVFGLRFDNPVGLAAGFDKNASAATNLQKQGFGFLECGTVTPLPQDGNAKPRLFRLQPDEAIINRLGFNNKGLDAFVQQMEKRPRQIPVGANIGKNRDTEDALTDYLKGLRRCYPVSDYITVNISSPNTAGLRDLQSKARLEQLLDGLLDARKSLAAEQDRTVPLLLKIAPDLDDGALQDIAALLLAKKLDGCIVSNTTVDRPATLRCSDRKEKGGLSGKPLMQPSTEILRQLYRLTEGRIPLIGVGGIASGADAYAKIKAGASLVQLYTALIYQGFGLVTRIKRDLAALLEKDGYASITEAIGKDHK